MDGESFDRLSVAVHRLRDQATRRSALRLLLGGSVVAVTGLSAEDADAKRRKKHKNKHGNKGRKNCRVGAIRCRRNRDCCFGNCRNGFCFGSGGGGGGSQCNGQRCQNGWECCRFQGIAMCLPRDDWRCGGDGGFCPVGWEDCGWNNGIRQCCGSNQRCCGNGRCCPDLSGWHCGDIACEFRQDAETSSEAERTTPFEHPIPVDEIDPEEFE